MMFAKMILASECDGCPPIYTLHLRFPRCLLPELNTHRALSKNTRSSRAVPVKKMIEEVRANPFVPKHWGRNIPGMQAGADLDAPVQSLFLQDANRGDWASATSTKDAHAIPVLASRDGAWLNACSAALLHAEAFAAAGYHKQLVNRLLEPFAWADSLVTGTEWANFLHLRDHADAEPHLRDLAVMIREAIEEAEPQRLAIGEWHMPYITDAERAGMCHEHLLDLSAVRCARISYAPFNGQDSLEAEQERVGKLKGEPLHASPFEHQAMADPTCAWPGRHRNFDRWAQYRAVVEAA